jgi:hypothetical protein
MAVKTIFIPGKDSYGAKMPLSLACDLLAANCAAVDFYVWQSQNAIALSPLNLARANLAWRHVSSLH